MRSKARLSGEPAHLLGRSRISQNVLSGILLAGVMAAVAAAYWPALSARALWFDDEQYLIDNPLVQDPGWKTAGRFLAEVFEPSTVRGYYQPLAMISLMLDYAAGGRPDDLRPFRRTSLFLHVLNSGLVAVLLYLLFHHRLAAALSGLLYGIHPFTIESAVWLAERKTLLATFLALCCLVVYTRYAQKSRARSYGACLILYLLSLMAKPTATPVPLLMLLMDYWPLRRLHRRALLEKIPFFVVAGASAAVTVISQARTAGTTMPGDYAASRIPLVVCHNIFFYLHRILLPLEVSWFYPFPEPLSVSQPSVAIGVAGTLLLIVALFFSLRWTRALLTGGLFFFIAVFPTLGVVGFTVVIAANRFAYFPAVGLLLPLAAGLGRVWEGASAGHRQTAMRAGVLAAMLLACAACAAGTRHYLTYWRDSERLARYSLALAPQSFYLHQRLGNTLEARGRLEAAADSFRTALRLAPTFAPAHTNLGTVLFRQGRVDEAVTHLSEAVRLGPHYAEAYNNLGVVLEKQGMIAEALGAYAKALSIRPRYASAHANRALALVGAGRLDEAVAHAEEALRLRPNDAEFCNRLGAALTKNGDLAGALKYYGRSLRIDPGNGAAFAGRAKVLALLGRTDAAISQYQEALRIRPDDAILWSDLGVVLAQAGKRNEAIAHFNKALALDPAFAKAHNNLGAALAARGQLDEAIDEFRAALHSDPGFVDAHLNLGRALLARGDAEGAVATFRQAVLIEPANTAARFSLAQALEGQGRRKAAAQQYGEVLRLDPSHDLARSRLRALIDSGQDSH